MPRVPVVGPETPAIRPVGTPYQSVSFSPEAFGAGIGAEIQQGAAVADRLYEKWKKEANATARSAAQVRFSEAIDPILYNPPAPQGQQQTGPVGFKYLQGEKAFEALEPTETEIRKIRDEIAASLKDEPTRQEFLDSTAGHLLAANREMMAHVGAEVEQTKDLTFQAKWKRAVRSVGDAYNDPTRQLVESKNMNQAIDDEADRKQIHGVGREEFKAQWQREAVQAALDGFLAANDWQGARDYLNKTGAVLDTKVRESYAKAIEPLKNSVQGEVEARRIIAGASRGGSFDLAAAETELGKMEPGPVFDEARRRVEHESSIADAKRADQLEGLFNEAYAIVNRIGTTTPMPETPGATAADLARLPQLKAAIIGRRASLWEGIEQIADRMQRKPPDRDIETPAELETYFRLTQAAATDPLKFLDVRVNQDYGANLSNRHLEHLNALQAEARRVQAQGAAEYNLLTDSKIVNYYAAQANIIPADVPGKTEKWSKNAAAQYQQLFDYVKARTDEIRNAGKKPTHEDVEKITRAGLRQVLLQTQGFFGAGQETVFSFAVKPDQHTHEIIPVQYRRQILEALLAERITPTEDLIQSTWLEWKAKHPDETETVPPEPLAPLPPTPPPVPPVGRR
jgi:hypothetical protein